MKIFRKLIRDKMPEIYAREGTTLTTRTLTDDAEYFEWLRRKLIEELQEMTEEGATDDFLKDRFAYLDEIADLMRDVKGFSAQELEEIKQRIIAERGSFTKRLLLEP